MAALLCLRVRQAYLSESIPAQVQTYIVIKFDYVKTSTVVAAGTAPLWEQDFIFEVTSESDCIAFELWSKAHDEAAEQMIGALCIPLDHITRIDQSGLISGPGGYGDWYHFDAEFIIHGGCIAGTRGETGHSLLIDAYIEEPSVYSAEDVAAYYYNCGLSSDGGNGAFALSTNSIQQQFQDGASCDSDYTSDYTGAYHPSQTPYMNYGPYDFDYDGIAAFNSGDEHTVNGAWPPSNYPINFDQQYGPNYQHGDPSQYYLNQWDYPDSQNASAEQQLPVAAGELPSPNSAAAALINGDSQHYYSRPQRQIRDLMSEFAADQSVPDEWSYYANEQLRALQDSGHLTPESKPTAFLASGHGGNSLIPSPHIDNFSDHPALDLSFSASDKDKSSTSELEAAGTSVERSYEQRSSFGNQQLQNDRALLSSAQLEPLELSISPESGQYLSYSDLSPNLSNSAMSTRRLPILPTFSSRSKTRTPTPPAVIDQTQLHLMNNNEYSSSNNSNNTNDFNNFAPPTSSVNYNDIPVLTEETTVDTQALLSKQPEPIPATNYMEMPQLFSFGIMPIVEEPEIPESKPVSPPAAYLNETFQPDENYNTPSQFAGLQNQNRLQKVDRSGVLNAAMPEILQPPIQQQQQPQPPLPIQQQQQQQRQQQQFDRLGMTSPLPMEIPQQQPQQQQQQPTLTLQQQQQQPQLFVHPLPSSGSPKNVSASNSQQLLHSVLSPKSSTVAAYLQEVGSPPPRTASPTPAQNRQPSLQNSPAASRSPSMEPVNQPSSLAPSRSPNLSRVTTPVQSRTPSAAPSPSPSLTFAKPDSSAEKQKIDKPSLPSGVLSPSPSTERVKAEPPSPPVEEKVKPPEPEKDVITSPPLPAAAPVKPAVIQQESKKLQQRSSLDNETDERARSRWLRAFGQVREQIASNGLLAEERVRHAEEVKRQERIKQHKEEMDNLLSEETDAMPDMPGGNDRNRTDFYNQINTSSDLKPQLSKMSHVSELTVAANKRKAEAQTAVIMSRALNDEELKMHVYKKTLQALLYPMSKTSGDHKFEIFSAKHPTYCFECEGLLWGLARQGLRCTQCGVKCHDRCKALMNADCLQRAAEKSARQGAHDRAQVFMNIITDLMKKREVEKKETFELIRKIFNVEDKVHQSAIEQSKQTMLDGASKWSANISITVVSAQGLMGKDATGTSDPYVTIQLGRTKRRTKTKFKTLNPEWNEKFFFECHNISERIKIRVWDEDDDFKSRLRQKFTRESDDFLGQYIIDVAKLCGDSDIWCNLEKRTDRSMVSGAIRLQISIEIKGEEKIAPYYDQYTCLHENFFHFIYDQPNSPPSYIPPGDATDAWERYFEPQVQEIVEEFAQRYGIDRIYMAMTHFSCLATKLLNPSVPPLLSDLLAHINVHYAHSASAAGSSLSSSGAGNNSQNRFNASNFRKEKFTKLLDQLHNSIRLELIDYRNNFPASEPMRLRDLQACVDLLTSINFFRMKVQGLVSPPKASAVVEECIKANMRRTYQFLYDHCYELYQKEFEANEENKPQPSEQPDEQQGPVLKNLDFWHKLIALIVSVIEEDRNTYGPVLNQFPSVKVGDISALILWQQLADDLEGALMEHEKSRNKCKSSEYMNLHFKIKWLYSKYVAVLPEMKSKNPEYPRWFESFVMIWLNDNDEVSLDCVKSAYERDKRDGFPKTSEQTNFSNSVVDMFSQLTQCHDVIKKLECPDATIKTVYMSRFAKTIEKVLISYGEFIENDFINFIQDQKTTCILLNNMQQTRVNLEKLFELMGGKELDKNTAEVLNELQERLNAYLDRFCAMAAEGLSGQVREQVVEMSKLLQQKVKGNQPNQPLTQPSVIEQIHQESDLIVQPLMEYLENCISTYADNCDKTILKRMLKELWVVTLTNLEKTIVLPPQDAKKLSLANLGADSAKDKVKDVSSLLLNKVQNKVANVNVASLIQDISGDSQRSLSARQCAVIQAALETIKGYFHADGQGLKMPFLEKSSQLKSLQYALSLYTHTTDMLIKTFVQSQAKQDGSAVTDGAGDLQVQVDLFTHPGTGEHKINVKVVACNNLRWSNSARPFVSVTLVGPSLAQRKRKWDTKSKTGTLAPVFNESYQFLIGNEGEIPDYELHFSVKDYCFGSDDKIIGIAVVKMAEIATSHQGSLSTWLQLAATLKLDDTGYTILRILSQRSSDDVAKEFVKLKSERRPV